jgi:hypothetical protein
MTEDERKNHVYLGDGVYAEATPIHIILRTGDHRDTHCDNTVYLEQDVLVHFLEWLAHVKHIDQDSPVKYLHLEKLFGILSARCKEKIHE